MSEKTKNIENEKLGTTELTKRFSKRFNVPKNRSGEFISNFLTLLEELLVEGNSVQLRGLGSFNIETLPAGEVRNPLKNTFVRKGERYRVKFQLSDTIRTKVKLAEVKGNK